MEDHQKVVILIPALNPNEKLVSLVKDLKENKFRNIIIVNDGSSIDSNKYFEEVKKEGVILLEHAVNLGKGRALKTGLNEYLKNFSSKIGIVTVDADGQHQIEDIKKVSKKLLENPRCLVLGSRNFEKENVPFKSRYGNKITRTVFGFFTGIKIKDTQTGLRGISTEHIKILMNTEGERFEYEMNMLMEAKKHNIDIVEQEIETIYEQNNKASHFNPLRDSYKIYMIFLKYILSSSISFVLDIGIYKILFNIFIKRISDYAILISTIGARVVSSLVNYKINKNKVFKQASSKSIIKYYLLCGIQMMVSAALVSVIFNLAGKQSEVLIKVIVDIILFFINFKIQREWVFKRGETK